MPFGLIGKKIGMTQLFDEVGNVTPVTVIEAGPCTVLEKNTLERNGYISVLLGFAEKKGKHTRKPQAEFYKKKNLTPMKFLKEFRFAGNDQLNIGDVVDAGKFEENQFVDVTGVTKGKGFQGVIRRYGMSGGPAAHGSHLGQKEAGSTGCREKPGHVFKNHRMAGHMGNEQVTVQSLKIVKIDKEQNLMFVTGAVPGINQGIVYINTAVKKN